MNRIPTPQLAGILVLAAIWGASFMFIKVMLEAMGPVAIAWLRLVGGAALVLGVAAVRGARLPRSRRYWIDAAVVAVLARKAPREAPRYATTAMTPNPDHRGETVAILLAAGLSARMSGEDKLWADLGGEPLVARSLRTLAAIEELDALVVVAPVEHHAELYRLGTTAGRQVLCVTGGDRRRDSVGAALEAAPAAAWYLVHDAARPLASAGLARRLLEAVRTRGAVVPALAITDTVKRVDALGLVVETLPRGELRAVQTPQAFEGDQLRRAHALDEADATDDAALVERLGAAVHVIDGETANLKVTTARDLALVRALAGLESQAI